MSLRSKFARLALVSVVALGVAGCAVPADRKTTNTALGAGLGGAAGAVLSQGDPLITVGGAAAGGILGNILTDDSKDRYKKSDRRRVQQRRHRGNGKHWR